MSPLRWRQIVGGHALRNQKCAVGGDSGRHLEPPKLTSRVFHLPCGNQWPLAYRCFLVMVALKSGSLFATQSTNLRTPGSASKPSTFIPWR